MLNCFIHLILPTLLLTVRGTFFLEQGFKQCLLDNTGASDYLVSHSMVDLLRHLIRIRITLVQLLVRYQRPIYCSDNDRNSRTQISEGLCHNYHNDFAPDN